MTYSPDHFALFRILFGSYLAFYLTCLFPYAAELYAADSFFVTTERGSFAFRQLFPSLLDQVFLAAHPSLFVATLVGVALAFGLGVGRRLAGVILWYGLTCLVNRNPGTMNPSHAFVGWLCLAAAIVPAGEPWAWTRRRVDWRMPRTLYWGAWWVMTAAYFASGISKLQSPGWLDGTAIRLALDMTYARHSRVGEVLLNLPDIVLRCCTWAALGAELLSLPFAFFAATRRIIWYAMLILHATLCVLFDFWELSAGMLLFHLFVYDDRWPLPFGLAAGDRWRRVDKLFARY